MGGLDIPFHYGDLPPSYDEPLTLEQRLDIMEMNVREKIEVARSAKNHKALFAASKGEHMVRLVPQTST